jgi:hypothetical protein
VVIIVTGRDLGNNSNRLCSVETTVTGLETTVTGFVAW